MREKPSGRELWRLYRKAVDEHNPKEALRIARLGVRAHTKTDRRHSAVWQRAIASVLFQQRQYQDAYRAALRSSRMTDDVYEKALSLVTVAMVQRFDKQPQKALVTLSHVERITGGLRGPFRKDAYLWSHYFGIRASVNRALDLDQAAICDAEGAAALLIESGHYWRAAIFLNNAAVMLLDKNRLADAKEKLFDVLALL